MPICTHEYTTLLSDEMELEWEWCIRCGCIRHAGQSFTPGKHQREAIVPDSAIPIPDDLKALADKHGGVLAVEEGVEVDDRVWGVFFYGGASGDDIVAGGSTPTEALDRARAIMQKWEGGF